jgi:hypothetical protein
MGRPAANRSVELEGSESDLRGVTKTAGGKMMVDVFIDFLYWTSILATFFAVCVIVYKGEKTVEEHRYEKRYARPHGQ